MSNIGSKFQNVTSGEEIVISKEELDEILDTNERLELELSIYTGGDSGRARNGTESNFQGPPIRIDRPEWVGFVTWVELRHGDDFMDFTALTGIGTADPASIRTTAEELDTLNSEIRRCYGSAGVEITIWDAPSAPDYRMRNAYSVVSTGGYVPVHNLLVSVVYLHVERVGVSDFPEVKRRQTWSMVRAWDALVDGIREKQLERDPSPSGGYSSIYHGSDTRHTVVPPVPRTPCGNDYQYRTRYN